VAQVDLQFDNADRSIPFDHPEVTVSRKLYRSGDSEYLINGTVARLKDIREMFLDTGIGVDAYSVIEQGRVDQLLQSSPVERRIIFEEAAGISRYKARKKEAERKLERTNQNLLRVADVIEELEKRLRSVSCGRQSAQLHGVSGAAQRTSFELCVGGVSPLFDRACPTGQGVARAVR
jgi:chromosome segregation protein